MENADAPKVVFIKPDESLHRSQIRTINVLRGRSRCDSLEAEPELRNRIAKLCDLNPEETLVLVKNYIEHSAPCVIHVRPEHLPLLIKDGNYRNTFEVRTTQGRVAEDGYLKNRAKWESECFLGLYDDIRGKPIDAYEKPKYGALNFLNNPTGVPSAAAYGKCYLKLKDSTRHRITVATGDTSGSRILGVLPYCCHVLKYLADNELTQLIDVASGAIKSGVTKLTYREIQIHGSLVLARDVASLHVPKGTDSAIVDQFSETFNVPAVYF